MSEVRNIIDNMNLNLSLDSSVPELISESKLYGFAHGALAKTLEELLGDIDVEGDVVIESLTVDLKVDGSRDVFSQIDDGLHSSLMSMLKPAIFKAQSTPVTNMLADVYRHHLPLEKTSDIDFRFKAIAESWDREHPDQKFNSLSLAEAIIRRMHQEFPNVDMQQIAYVVYQKIMQQKNAQKQQAAQNARKAPVTSDGKVLLEVADAGLVLISPYLPALFERSGCIEKGAFVSDEARFKALSVLKYVAFGMYQEPIKNAAVMNLLCGLPSSPVSCIEDLPKISDDEKSLVDGLLKAVVANWRAVGNMSPDGLRSTFFVRCGKLDTDGGADLLTVENKTFDILVEKLPWSYSMIKHPWMPKVLNVKWR